jgi:hypothetical protein
MCGGKERFELAMVAFLLRRAPVLERLVLVAVDGEGAPGDELLDIMRDEVSSMAMAASSPDVLITVCRPSEDSSDNAAHWGFYHEE